jgi:hypothetical protein
MTRLRGKLTYANVVATLALFLVIAGGSAFAASKVGKNSVGTKQIKNNAVTATKIKNGAVTEAKIANGAVTAAKIANGAVTEAKIGNGAVTGSKIGLGAVGAANINTSGLIVPNASHANSADSATDATNATHAGDAQTLQGLSAAQITAASTLKCPSNMVPLAGLCFESAPRPATDYTSALQNCAKAGLVLPSVTQLWTFQSQTFSTQPPLEWAGQLFYDGTHLRAEAISETLSAGGSSSADEIGASHPYRCGIPPSN